MNISQDEKYMRQAVRLAEKGAFGAPPNPLVGAVIVKDGRIIGRGWHKKYGEFHAERNALADCSESPEGGTIYVTLEPCCHHGKQPPCTDAIIESGIRKVVIGSDDPNPMVAGRSAKILQEAGIETVRGVLKKECDALNPVFFRHISTGLPYVTMKYAMTLDGKIATFTGKSQWISCEESRKHTHRTRSENMGIMVGVETVLADDPLLTSRIKGGVDPVRIVCDSKLRTPLDSRLVKTASESGENQRLPRTVIATTVTEEERIRPYQEKGCLVISIPPNAEGHLDLPLLMIRLGELPLSSILLEGGSTLSWSMLKDQLVQSVHAYIAPKLFGGRDASSPVGGTGVEAPDDAFEIRDPRIQTIGNDLLVTGEIVYKNPA